MTRILSYVVLLLAVIGACRGKQDGEPVVKQPSADVAEAPPLASDGQYPMLGERFELADVVALVVPAGCPAGSVRVKIKRVFKGDVEPGALVDVGRRSCAQKGWVNARGDLYGEELLLFAEHRTSQGRVLEPLRHPQGKWKGWLHVVSKRDLTQVAEVLSELAEYSSSAASREQTVNNWLHSRNQHLRLLGVAHARDEAKTDVADGFIEALFRVLRSRGTSQEVRVACSGALADILERWRSSHRLRHLRDVPLYDRYIRAHLELAAQTPASDAEGARAVAYGLRVLAHRRHRIEGVWHNLDGSSDPALPGRGIPCEPDDREGECETRWYDKHGEAAVAFWRNWVDKGGHMRLPNGERRR